MSDPTAARADTYTWVTSSVGKTAHAVTPRLVSNEYRTSLVCGKGLHTTGVVAALDATRCKSCVRHIEDGTGWA